MQTLYDQDFYATRDSWTRASAEAVAALVCKMYPVNSVCDVGCGVGTWLSAFISQGVSDVTGLDGEWVDREKLVIPQERFIVADLSNPTPPARSFDLAISLEVAEHIDQKNSAGFIDFLTSLAPNILFAAAIPGQGGVGHVNEQWPNYWIRLFHERGYVAVDCIRPRIWNNPKILPWYRQNSLMFIRGASHVSPKYSQGTKVANEKNIEIFEQTTAFDIVHPDIYSSKLNENIELSAKIDRQRKKIRALTEELRILKAEKLSLNDSARVFVRNVIRKSGLTQK